MRIYIVILSDIKSVECDQKFSDLVKTNNWEWWRYTALNWILATPDTVSTNDVLTNAIESYGVSFITILEVSINDVAGLFPSNEIQDQPFVWFNTIKDSTYIPKWERVKTKDSEESK